MRHGRPMQHVIIGKMIKESKVPSRQSLVIFFPNRHFPTDMTKERNEAWKGKHFFRFNNNPSLSLIHFNVLFMLHHFNWMTLSLNNTCFKFWKEYILQTNVFCFNYTSWFHVSLLSLNSVYLYSWSPRLILFRIPHDFPPFPSFSCLPHHQSTCYRLDIHLQYTHHDPHKEYTLKDDLFLSSWSW